MNDEVKKFLSLNGKKGIKALHLKYDEETRRKWARMGGLQKGVNHKAKKKAV